MIGRTNTGGGGGGGSMSMCVVEGIERPSNPSENMVWVNTRNEITDYVFSKSQPTTLEAGMVWFEIADSSSVEIITPVGKDFVKLCLRGCKQYIGGKWSSAQAWIYQNGAWTKWSETFTAYIVVTYPANSTCTCSFGGVTYYTDVNTGASEKTVTFNALDVGEWTIKCYNGADYDSSEKKNSTDVEITAEGQSVSKKLAYELVLFNNGDLGLMSIGFSLSHSAGTASLTVGNTVRIATQSNGAISYMSNAKIDLTGYKALKCTNVASSGNAYLVIDTERGNESATAGQNNPAQGTGVFVAATTDNSLPLEAYNGEYYVGIACGTSSVKEISQLVLE